LKPAFEHPIDHIKWLDAELLLPNEWNPNHVYGPELKLLERSIMSTGWIQPVLVSKTLVIIDGEHRVHLARTSRRVKEFTGGKVPCAILDLSEPERIMLTVRINRAKGSHIAIKMHDLVAKLVTEHGMDPQYVAESMGATKDEIEVLMQDGIFKALKVDQHAYSRAWVPK
jgi:ParB-like chromosome segregation protein Spo0J